jgi:pantothenate kinase
MSDWLGDSNGPMGDWGAFMSSELRLPRAELAGQIAQLGGARVIVAIAGAPGAGKSRLAAELAEALTSEVAGRAAVVPLDGFHLDNATLEARGLRQLKGAPETFDVEGFSSALSALRAGHADVTLPGFDRAQDAVLPGAITVPAGTRFVLVEGNYLLLTRAPWRDLFPQFDLTVRLDVPPELLRARLVARWRDLGLAPAEITRRVEENDLPNGALTARENRGGDFVIRD